MREITTLGKGVVELGAVLLDLFVLRLGFMRLPTRRLFQDFFAEASGLGEI